MRRHRRAWDPILLEQIFKSAFVGAVVLFFLYARLQSDAAPASVSQTSPAPSAPEPDNKVVEPAPPPEPVPAAPRVFYDQVTYVAQEQAFSYVITAKAPTEIKVVVDIDSTAPIELRIYQGNISSTEYSMMQDRELQVLGAVVKGIYGNQSASEPEAPKPTLAFIQRGVYRHFETEWLAVEPGDYSIIADNTGSNMTPSRGDAPVRLQVMERSKP
jgi:hypothetical protein